MRSIIELKQRISKRKEQPLVTEKQNIRNKKYETLHNAVIALLEDPVLYKAEVRDELKWITSQSNLMDMLLDQLHQYLDNSTTNNATYVTFTAGDFIDRRGEKSHFTHHLLEMIKCNELEGNLLRVGDYTVTNSRFKFAKGRRVFEANVAASPEATG